MSQNTGIEWTDATPMIDRNGRRIRHYQRNDPSRPGQQLRRAMAAQGLRWCHSCRDWLPSADVDKNGLCLTHRRVAYNTFYAANRAAIAAEKTARKRGIGPIPELARIYLAEQFGGLCAYCPAPATTWDHLFPVAKGGRTRPGNIVPACNRCNSSKRASEPLGFIERRGIRLEGALLEAVALACEKGIL